MNFRRILDFHLSLQFANVYYFKFKFAACTCAVPDSNSFHITQEPYDKYAKKRSESSYETAKGPARPSGSESSERRRGEQSSESEPGPGEQQFQGQEGSVGSTLTAPWAAASVASSAVALYVVR